MHEHLGHLSEGIIAAAPWRGRNAMEAAGRLAFFTAKTGEKRHLSGAGDRGNASKGDAIKKMSVGIG